MALPQRKFNDRSSPLDGSETIPEIPKSHLVKMIKANVSNSKISDREFRNFIRRSIDLYDRK